VYTYRRVVTGSIAEGKGRAIAAERRKTTEKKVRDGKIKSYLDFRTADTATGRLAATASTAGVVPPSYHSRLLYMRQIRVFLCIGAHIAFIVRVSRDKCVRR